MRTVVLVFSLALSVTAADASGPRQFLDLDFEAPECTSGWFEVFSFFFEGAIVSEDAASGKQSLRIRYEGLTPYIPQRGSGGYARELPADAVAGKSLRISGLIRTQNVTRSAGFFVVTVRTDGSERFVNQSERPTGTTPWTAYSFETSVPADVAEVYIGAGMAGDGAAYFDDLAVHADGEPLRQVPPPILPTPTPGHVASVLRSMIALTTVQAGHGFADLEPLKKVFAGVDIVSVGEATHGTREFVLMKHRLLEFLATEMGFNYFAIEANMPEAARVNEYLLTGVGDPAELLEGLRFWTWNTQEVLEMILWMREFNASGRGPLRFTGFDAQFGGVAAENLRAFLTTADPAYLSTAESVFARIATAEATRLATPEDVAAIRALFDHISGNREAYIQYSDEETVDWMIQNAQVLVQVIEHIAGVTSRDLYMARNVEWIIDHAPAGSKIMLWAHNFHVMRAEEPSGFRPMGMYLAQRYGDRMYTMGFAYGTGLYNTLGARGLTSYETHTPVPGSLETLLEATLTPRLMINFREPDGTAPELWFQRIRFLRGLGSAVVRCGFFPIVAADAYDGLIWIDQTNPSALLPFD